MACLDLVNAKGMTIQSNFVEIKMLTRCIILIL